MIWFLDFLGNLRGHIKETQMTCFGLYHISSLVRKRLLSSRVVQNVHALLTKLIRGVKSSIRILSSLPLSMESFEQREPPFLLHHYLNLSKHHLTNICCRKTQTYIDRPSGPHLLRPRKVGLGTRREGRGSCS